MRVGLVLGAGGVLGGAWLSRGLDVLAAETGWDPGRADYIVGTSAGAMIGGLLACGVPPWFMVAHSAGDMETLRSVGVDRERAGSSRPVYRLHRGLPGVGPGSWRLALASLARPTQFSPGALLAGWAPRGIVSAQPLKDTIGRVAAEGWAPHPHMWAVACEHDTGRRVAFGREDAPPARLADAVAASCAIPGFYHPVRIGRRDYVDGGVASPSNLDLLAGLGLDLVICLNPTSSLDAAPPRTLGERAAAAVRTAAGRRLGSEAKRVRGAGTEVVLIQPTLEDLTAMGPNLMGSRRRPRVLEVAARTMADQLEATGLRERLAGAPRGRSELLRRPPASERLDFLALARERWELSAA